MTGLFGSSAAYFCTSLNDQDATYSFEKPLLNNDAIENSLFEGLIGYKCNETDGGVTYIQNLTFKGDYPHKNASDPDGTSISDPFELSASASLRQPLFKQYFRPTLSNPTVCLESRARAAPLPPCHIRVSPPFFCAATVLQLRLHGRCGRGARSRGVPLTGVVSPVTYGGDSVSDYRGSQN
eukprot:SAG11_NODE_1218_length_5498_cov_11.478422_1_plen_181_part_00